VKIFEVCPRSPVSNFGGIEHCVWEISKRLAKKGYEIEIFTTSRTKCPRTVRKENVKIHEFPSFAPSEAFYFSWQLYQSLRRNDSDLLHGHGYSAFPLILSAFAKHPRQKFVASLHSGSTPSAVRKILHIPFWPILTVSLRRADKIVCVSRSEYRNFQGRLGLPKERYAVIPNAIDKKEFVDSNQKERVKIGKPYILSVARLEKSKGLQFLIRSLKHLQLDHADLRLVIVGQGPYKQHLNELAEELDLAEKVLFFTNCPRGQLLALYRDCSLFALLSQGESSGIAVLEALAARKPALLANSYALNEYIKNGQAVGVAYPPKIHAVSAKISEILENPRAFEPKNVQLPTWDEVSDEMACLYETLLLK
jgi:glycosyltransferase involved in cell wall biosynthesis